MGLGCSSLGWNDLWRLGGRRAREVWMGDLVRYFSAGDMVRRGVVSNAEDVFFVVETIDRFEFRMSG